MNATHLRRVGGTSAAVCVLLLATLTVLRVENAEPPTAVQSTAVNATATLVTLAVAGYAYRGGGYVGGWILSAGPALAFTLNLFAPVSPMGPLSKGALAVSSAAVVSGALALVGVAVGRGLRRLATSTSSPGTP